MNEADVNPSGLDGLADLSFNAYTIRRIFLLLTRVHYSDPANYGPLAEQFKNYVWKEGADGASEGGLFIDYDFNYDPKNVDRRPAIYVGTTDLTTAAAKMVDEMSRMTESGAGYESATTGTCQVVVRHIAKRADETLMLADLTFQFFLGIRRLLKEKARLRGYRVLGVSTTRPFERIAEKTDMTFIADVRIALDFNCAWLEVRESHRIKTMNMRGIVAAFDDK